MDDLDLLFYQAESEYKEEAKDIIEKVIADSRTEFTGYSKEHQSRQAEIKELNEKIKSLYSDFNKHKNIKSSRPSHKKLNEKRAVKRKAIKNEIEICRLRLKEIEEEVRPIGGGKKEDEDEEYTGEVPKMPSNISGLTKTSNFF
jgi:predicted  nucleic acid-binding Zn-ribbon protein